MDMNGYQQKSTRDKSYVIVIYSVKDRIRQGNSFLQVVEKPVETVNKYPVYAQINKGSPVLR